MLKISLPDALRQYIFSFAIKTCFCAIFLCVFALFNL